MKTKWITGLNVKPKAIKLLRENVRGDLHNLWLDIDFLGKTSKAQCMTEEMIKVDFMIILKLIKRSEREV